MNAQEFKASLSVQDIINFVTQALGSEDYKEDDAGNPIFQTIDHNSRGQGKYKLYYYPDNQVFVSYTAGKTMDIYSLTQEAGYASDFRSAYQFVAHFFGYDIYSEEFAQVETTELTADWDLLNKFAALNQPEPTKKVEKKIISKALLEYFPNFIPYEWYKEGIAIEAMQKFGIRMDTVNQKIIIPHYDVEGQLIGIRGRSFNWYDLQRGAKYSPIYLGVDSVYNHPLGEHLYGLWANKETIRQTKTVVIVEAEKSVLLSETYFPNHNFTVAVCGSSITDMQVNLLLSLGVTQVILALDKESPSAPGCPETLAYKDKLLNMAYKFTPYVATYIIMDHSDLLGLKDSPFDKGKEVLIELMKQKEQVLCLNTLQQKGRKKR